MGEGQEQKPEVEVQLTEIVVRQSTELLFFKLALAEFLFAAILIVYFFVIRFVEAGLSAAYVIDLTFVFILLVDILFRTSIILLMLAAWANRTFIIKSDRVSLARGIFSPSFTDLHFGLISGVEVKQDFLGKLLNYGTLVLTVGGRPPLEIPDLPDPYRYGKILEGVVPFKEKIGLSLKKGGSEAEEEERKRRPFEETSTGMTSRKK